MPTMLRRWQRSLRGGGGSPAQFRVRPDVVVVVPSGNELEAAMRQRENSIWFRHSTHRRPLKLTTKPFCIGLPGAL